MPDTLSPTQRSRCMAAVRGKDTSPELKVRSIAHRLGFRFRLHDKLLPGRPDLVFRSKKTVIFVHGCFWHLHTCKSGKNAPRTNAGFWKRKRESNKRRDARVRRALQRAGWRVLVIWECQLRDPDRVTARIHRVLSTN